MQSLHLKSSMPVEAENGGLFISPGTGRHPERIIASHELIFVRSGCLHLEEAGRIFAIRENESLLLWPDMLHRGTADYKDDLSFYWVHFRAHAGGGNGGTAFPQHGRPANPERMVELFHRFLDEQESGTLSSQKAALLVMLMLLEMPEAPAQIAEPNALAGRARDYIAAHFHQGIHAGTIARAMGCNADYLGRVYRRVHGHTLSQAIHIEQIRKARVLLRESNSNMEEIAAACGFPESRYFRKLFADHHGMSPRDYRKLYTRRHVNTR